jgi:DNA recombination protein RmuC
MDTTLLGLLMIVVILLLGALIAVLYMQLRKLQDNSADSAAEVQYLAQSIQQSQIQAAALSEKLNRIEPVPEAVGQAEIELRGLTERVATMEQSQTMANQGIAYLSNSLIQTDSSLKSEYNKGQQQSINTLYQIGTRLDTQISKVEQETGSSFAELRTLTNSLIDAAASTRSDLGNAHQQSIATANQIGSRLASEISQFQQSAGVELAELRTMATGISEAISSTRSELSRAKNDLTEIQSSMKARTEIEQQTAVSIRRLEAIIAGTQSKGLAGENILEMVFAKLPAEWQVRNFRVGGRPVEFGLRLPNNLILPIDSKWAATNLLEQFVAAESNSAQQELKAEIESVVLQKAKEVKKYIDPSVTVGFGIAVIPDAVFDLCTGVQAEVFQLSVVLVSYSMFVPYLLLVFQTILKTEQSIDLQKVSGYIQMAQENVKALQEEIDGRFSKAITMLNNSRDDMRAHVSKLGGGLTGLQINTAVPANVSALTDTPSDAQECDFTLALRDVAVG